MFSIMFADTVTRQNSMMCCIGKFYVLLLQWVRLGNWQLFSLMSYVSHSRGFISEVVFKKKQRFLNIGIAKLSGRICAENAVSDSDWFVVYCRLQQIQL